MIVISGQVFVKTDKRVFAPDVPGIHVLAAKEDVDGRDKPSQDEPLGRV
jgi:hypothetical protein